MQPSPSTVGDTHLEIDLPTDVAIGLILQAKAMRRTPERLIADLVGRIVVDDLYKAVLDD